MNLVNVLISHLTHCTWDNTRGTETWRYNRTTHKQQLMCFGVDDTTSCSEFENETQRLFLGHDEASSLKSYL